MAASTVKPYDNKEVGVGAAVTVGVPILIIIITAAIILLLVLAFLYYRSRQRKKQIESRGEYAPVPLKEDSGTAPSAPLPTKSLPYSIPPKISLADPPPPPMKFTMATQLSDVSTSGSRYPFIEHKHPEGRPLRDTRPPNKRTKKRGNHKHGNGRHVVLKSRSADTSSDVSDQSSDNKIATPTGDIRSRVYRSPSGKSPSQSEQEEAQLPDIYFTLNYNEDSSLLTINIDRVMSLPSRVDGSPVDSYVRLFLIPKLPNLPQRRTTKTQTQRRESCPIFDENVRYEAMTKEELINSTIQIEVMDYCAHGKHVVLGQTSVLLAQVTFLKDEASMKLPLQPPEVRESLGTVLLSLSYSPDTKKLSVIILRAKDLNRGNFKETDAQAKLWVSMAGEKFLGKLRTKKKQQSCSPIFNEALTCTVDPNKISNAAVNVAMMNEHKQAGNRALGQVTLCSQSMGEEFRHWNDVMATPGKHIAEWHELR